MKSSLAIKVCGLTTASNIREVAQLHPEFIGLIFYKHSKRAVTSKLNRDLFAEINSEIDRVGVFVNQDHEEILKISKEFSLNIIQMHGTETPTFCKDLLTANPELKIWKAFGIDPTFDFKLTREYEAICSHFLFDTKTHEFGGSGRSYDWSLLREYRGSTPFFLSGGIGPDNIRSAVKATQSHPLASGFDLNSKVESAPGIKCPQKIEQVIQEVRQ